MSENTMKLEWNNCWMHQKEKWLPLNATTLKEAGRELQQFLPQAEEGTRIRNANDHSQVWRWDP